MLANTSSRAVLGAQCYQAIQSTVTRIANACTVVAFSVLFAFRATKFVLAHVSRKPLVAQAGAVQTHAVCRAISGAGTKLTDFASKAYVTFTSVINRAYTMPTA